MGNPSDPDYQTDELLRMEQADGKTTMTNRQRELARHALGFPNKKNSSYRNHFCAGPGHLDYPEWLRMVAEGYAVRQTGPHWGGDDMFFLTLKGGRLARDEKEHLSREETAAMREKESEKSN